MSKAALPPSKRRRNVAARHRDLVSAGVPAVPLEFRYRLDGSHFFLSEDPAVTDFILQYLQRFEPEQ